MSNRTNGPFSVVAPSYKVATFKKEPVVEMHQHTMEVHPGPIKQQAELKSTN
jgi:hypothetical protein